MSVGAHAPGRIDGVLVVLLVEVLITTHSACLLMRAAHKELAQDVNTLEYKHSSKISCGNLAARKIASAQLPFKASMQAFIETNGMAAK